MCCRRDAASTSMFLPPLIGTLSLDSDRVSVEVRMFSATAAPTPALFASSASLFAFARSSSFAFVLRVTSALPNGDAAALDDRVRPVVRDDVDRHRACDADVGLAGARVRLGDDLVLGEAEELVSGRARREVDAVARIRLGDPLLRCRPTCRRRPR